MNLADLIQKHVKEIDSAARGASRLSRDEADLQAPANLYNDRIKRVDARIALLETQRAEADKRFVTAIDEQKQLRETMRKEAELWSERTKTKGQTTQLRRSTKRTVRQEPVETPPAPEAGDMPAEAPATEAEAPATEAEAKPATEAEAKPAKKPARKPAAKLALKPSAKSPKKPGKSK